MNMSQGDDQRQLSDAEKIRLKRIARLGTPSTQPAQAASIEPTPTAPAQNAAPTPPPVASSSKLPTSNSTYNKRKITPDLASRPTSTPPARDLPQVPYKQWEEKQISSVFSVTLERNEAERSNWQLCWLKDLAQELTEENVPLTTTRVIADRLLIARLQLQPDDLSSPDQMTILAGLPTDETVFEYLTGCWKRLYLANRAFNRLSYGETDKPTWQGTFESLRTLLISYIGLTLHDPTMFPQPRSRPLGPAEFLPILLGLSPASADPLTATTAPTPKNAIDPSDLLTFLNDLAVYTDQDLSEILSPTCSLLFQEFFRIEPTPDITGNDWRRYLGAVSILIQVKAIAATLPALDIWMAPNVTAPKLEWQSLLGPLTRLSVYPREFGIWKTYFSNPTERKVDDMDANKSNLRHTLVSLQTTMYQIYNSIVRASPSARESVLSFFALVVRLNARRAGMSIQSSLVSSDGFMTNLQVILLKLFEPVMDVAFTKLDKIDSDYYRSSKRIDISDETRIKATKEQIDAYTSMQVDKPEPNFISDLFFLLAAFQHLGLNKTISTRVKAEKNISDIEKELQRAEAARADWAGNAALEAQGEASIQKLKNDLATLHASIHAYDTQLLDPTLTRLNLDYTTFTMTWMIRLVDPAHRHPSPAIQLPLAQAPPEFSMLPEYFVENVAEYFEFIARYDPMLLEDADKDILITFVLVFLTPSFVNNPFLKAKLVSILALGLYPAGRYSKGMLFDRLCNLPVSTAHLMPTIIRFFIDVEFTGGHTQFWDKFNFRRDMSRIFKTLWGNPLHRDAFLRARHDDFDQFIKFVNMLMSDTTFHLEESLTNLAQVNQLRTRQAEETGLDQNQRQDIASQLAQAERSAPFHTAMGLDHVELIRDFTATTREPFVTAEIVDRLAATLDENLSVLVGPRMQDLRMNDPERFSFKPKRLLAGIAQIYLNLSKEVAFVRAVANDGRSYKKELFERFARILKHRAIMTDDEIAGIVSFTDKVEDMLTTIKIEDEREIPDEFLDPLLSTLMKDPVILPMSRVTVDRSTIRTALLSSDKDPFNNMPLKLEDCIPDDDLRGKIDVWLAQA